MAIRKFTDITNETATKYDRYKNTQIKATIEDVFDTGSALNSPNDAAIQFLKEKLDDVIDENNDKIVGKPPVYTDTIQTITGNKFFGTTTKLHFRDSGIYLNSNTNGTLQIVSDNKVNIFGKVKIMNSALTASGAISASGDITANAFIGDGSSLTSLPSQTDNNFTTTLKNKLDGISAGADVTPSWVPSSDPRYLTSVNASDVGLGNVTNESKATMFTNAALTGNPTAPTQTANDDSTKIATTAYVQQELTDLIGTAPAALDTLGELSASLAADQTGLASLTTTVGTKLAKSSNLSDLTNAETARTNLGLGSAATSDTGDFATAAQGTKADNALPKSGGTMTGAIAMGNFNITGVNVLTFSDPGPNEGINWAGGNTKIYESPDNLTTNSAGNLQFVYGSTRRLTVNNTGIDVNGNATVAGNLILDDNSGDSPSVQLKNENDVNYQIYNGSSDNFIITRVGNNGADFSINGSSTNYTNTTLTLAGAEISATKIGNWNTAYGWGNHASAGYSTATGVENNADVTDTANVTAAGALMDSEVTNLAQVKAFDSSDYATAAQGTKADTAHGWGNHASAGYLTRSAPGAPSSLSTSIVNDTIDLSFNKSSTSNIDYYLVFNSIDGSSDYGLISVIDPADFGNTMSVIDSTFSQTGTMAYRVYAVKNGVYSSAATTSQAFTISSLEPTNMSVTPLNKVYFIQWDPPSSKSKFVNNYKIYKHAHATQGSLSRSSASLIYTGNNTSYMYTIADEDKAKYHQFWVEITVA